MIKLLSGGPGGGVSASVVGTPQTNGTSVLCTVTVPAGELSSWDLEVRPAGGSWTTAATTIVDATYMVTGLSGASGYEFRATVRVVSEVTATTSATTATPPPDPVQAATRIEIDAYLASVAGFDGNDTVVNRAASETSEAWANTSAWISRGESPIVASGKLRGNGGGSLSFLLKLLGSIKYLATTIEIQASNGDDGHCFVGVSNNNFPEGLGGCWGWSINSGNLYRVVNGSLTSVGSVTTGTRYFVEIHLTATHASISLVGENSLQGGTITIALTGLTHFVLFNSDGLGASGKLIGPVDMKNAISRMATPGVASHYGMIGSDPGQTTYRWRAAFPKGFNPTLTYPVAILFHGLGTTAPAWFDRPPTDTNYPLIAQALIDAGYVIISADDPRSAATWGNSNTIAAYHQAFLAIRELVNINGLFVAANSMGGIEALNAISRAAIPADAAFFTSGTASLLSCYEGSFTADILAAYGASYANTVDYDPLLHVSELFNRVKGVAHYWATASDDASVDPTENSTALHNRLVAASGDSTLDITTGGHSFAINGAWPGKLTAFFASKAP